MKWDRIWSDDRERFLEDAKEFEIDNDKIEFYKEKFNL